ncbi:MAG: hypothetical protein ACRD3W_04880 [Terriglobales bacterium]
MAVRKTSAQMARQLRLLVNPSERGLTLLPELSLAAARECSLGHKPRVSWARSPAEGAKETPGF